MYKYVGNDPGNYFDTNGLYPVRLGNGRYAHQYNGDISRPMEIGRHVRHPKTNYDRECSTGSQLISGSLGQTGETYHDVPKAAHGGWKKGAPVGPNTPPGRLVASGWKNGVYPNDKSGNHVGNFLGMGLHGHILVLDQWDRDDRPLNFTAWEKDDWCEVETETPRDPEPSKSWLGRFQPSSRARMGGRVR